MRKVELLVRHVDCKKYDPNKHQDAPIMTEVDRGDDYVTMRCLNCKNEITIEGFVHLIHCAWIDSSAVGGKKRIAVVCGRMVDWEFWKPAQSFIKRNDSCMILECENAIYHGIMRSDQARGFEFDSMEICGHPSKNLIDIVKERMR